MDVLINLGGTTKVPLEKFTAKLNCLVFFGTRDGKRTHDLTVGALGDYKLRLPRVFSSLIFNVFSNDCLIDAYGGDKVAVRPDTVTPPVDFFKERESFL